MYYFVVLQKDLESSSIKTKSDKFNLVKNKEYSTSEWLLQIGKQQ